jgi:hypothetical protein
LCRRIVVTLVMVSPFCGPGNAPVGVVAYIPITAAMVSEPGTVSKRYEGRVTITWDKHQYDWTCQYLMDLVAIIHGAGPDG